MEIYLANRWGKILNRFFIQKLFLHFFIFHLPNMESNTHKVSLLKLQQFLLRILYDILIFYFLLLLIPTVAVCTYSTRTITLSQELMS